MRTLEEKKKKKNKRRFSTKMFSNFLSNGLYLSPYVWAHSRPIYIIMKPGMSWVTDKDKPKPTKPPLDLEVPDITTTPDTLDGVDTNGELDGFDADMGLSEVYKIKVNSKGKKRRKLKCQKGYHPNPQGTACVPMNASTKLHLKQGARKTKITKKAGGVGLKRRTAFKTKRALRYRKALVGSRRNAA